MKWWTVPRDWPEETVAVLASGPSLTREQCEYVRGKCKVIAISNQAINNEHSETKEIIPAFAPWADVLYAADTRWWNKHKDQAFAFAGEKVTIRDRGTLPEVLRVLQTSHMHDFDPRPTHIVSGGNSGYQGIHLAVHYGARKVILLGFDMKLGPKKQKHYFGDHPGNLNMRGNFPGWIRTFGYLAKALRKRGVEVVNCTTDTALTCFDRAPLEQTL